MPASKVVVRILLGLVALLLLIAGFGVLVATTPWGQQFVTKQVNNYLAKKINAPFRIGQVRYKIPDWLELEEVFVKTPQGDTLLNGGRLRVDMDMWGLLNNRVAINQIELERIRVNVSRLQQPGGPTPPNFNFQYLLDAFDTGESTPGDTTQAKPTTDTTSAPISFSLTGIALKDVRIRYRDDVAGAYVNAYVDSLRANFRETDLSKSIYHLDNVAVDGLNVRSRIYEGIPTPDDPASDPADTLSIGLGKWTLSRAQWDVDVATANFRTAGKAGRVLMESEYFYLDGQKIGIRSLELANSDVAATLTKPTPTNRQSSTKPKASSAVAEPRPEPEPAIGWFAKLGQVRLDNNRIRFDDQTSARQRSGFDYGHFDLRDLGIDGSSLMYQDLGSRGQRVTAKLRNGQFRATSGLTLRRLDADVLYTEKMTRLTNLLLQTPTTLLRDQLVLRYDSLAQLTDPRFANRVQVSLNLRQSRLSVADVLQLAPFLASTPPFDDRRAVISATTQLTGTLASLNVPRFDLDMLSGTHIRASGRLTNVTDPNRLGLDLTIREATTRLADINRLAPKGTLPNSVALPPSLGLTGRVRGQLDDLTLDANLQTDWGTAAFDGKLAGFMSGKNQRYVGTLDLNNFDAGKWLKQPPTTLGKLTGRATVNGRGIDPKTLSTTFDLNVQSADLQGYTYRNLDATGSLSGGNLTLNGALRDPNANLALDIRAGLQTDYPNVTGTVAIQELNLKPLGFYADPLSLKGDLVLNMTSTDPVRPVGTLSASDAVVTLNGKNYPVDSLYARLSAEGNTKAVLAQVPGARLRLNGQFEYTQLYDIVAGELSRYLALPQLTYKPVAAPYAFTIGARVYQNPLLQAFVPGLTRLDTVRLTASVNRPNGFTAFSSDTTLAATLRTGVVVYDTNTVRNATMNLSGVGNELFVNGRINSATASGIDIGPTSLTGVAANNRLRFGVVSRDSINQFRHGLAGTLSIIDKNYRLQLAPNGLLVNYQRWNPDTTGFAQYGPDGVLVSNLHIEQGSQAFEISSTEPYGNAPIRITTRSIELANLAELAGQDTTLAAGQLNGTVVVRDYLGEDSQLAFIGSVYVDSLRVMDKPIGNLTARFRNNSDGRISVNTVLTGQYNDATVEGYYNPENPKAALDLAVNLTRLDARTIEAFSFGELRQARGKLTGAFTVGGSLDNPQTNGNVAFDSVAFNIKQLNATYRIDQENLAFSGQTITFTDFNVRDTLGRTLTTDGTVVLRNLPDAAYNLRVRAQQFQVLNAARKDNDYAYGQAAVSADLRIKGTGANASVTGRVKLEEGSKISVVLPDETVDANEANQIVTFIDHNDSLAVAKYLRRPKRDSTQARLAFDQLGNSTISLDLEADEKSELTIVVDELNGDYLRARGKALLNVNVNAAGQVSVLGRYDVTEGEYSLTYQVLKRQFKIQKGGYINFTGDPLKADINITAIYAVSVAPADLIGNESTSLDANQLKRKLPFEVALTISDNLAAPKLDFDIRLAEGQDGGNSANAFSTTIDNKLKNLRQNQSQINKQVFALLVLNRFLPDNTSDFFSGSSGGGGLNTQAQNLALNSVSQLLSDQLGRLASGVLKGFDVDFGLLSQTGTDNNGQAINGVRTNLNVGLSRSFLEGRLTVSVGRNFVLDNLQLQNPNQVFDNLSVNYALTRDGRYLLRAYRRNDYQAVLDGFIIETGIGFIITIDYDTLSDILRRRASTGPPAAGSGL